MRVVGVRESRDSASVMEDRPLMSSTVTPKIGVGTVRPGPAGGLTAGVVDGFELGAVAFCAVVLELVDCELVRRELVLLEFVFGLALRELVSRELVGCEFVLLELVDCEFV